METESQDPADTPVAAEEQTYPQGGEQDALPASGTTPEQPRATSAPPPEAQSGVPDLQENADIDRDEVKAEQELATGTAHPEADKADGDETSAPEPTEPSDPPEPTTPADHE